MNASGVDGGATSVEVATPALAPASSTRDPTAAGTDAEAQFRRAARAPWVAAGCTAAGGLAFGLVLASAYCLAIPVARTPTRFALTLWVDLWPVVVAVAFTAPRFWRWLGVGAALYFAPFVLAAISLLVYPQAPEESAEALILALQQDITPIYMLKAWAGFAGAPTAVLLLFLNPRTRAVSPLMLAFMTIVAGACMVSWFAVFSAAGTRLVLQIVDSKWALVWLLLGALLVVMALSATVGWTLLSAVKRAYLARTISDRTLGLDALWLFFASYFAAQFAVQGALWMLAGVLAFIAYRIVFGIALARTRGRAPEFAPRGLTFLRVFSLGPKSNALFDALGMHWRRVGSLQLITGPDVAHSIVQPHQLLDFLSGRLARHFIGDARTLEARMESLERGPDRDGWFRINSLFCRADTWQDVLARLVRSGDVVLMDLRSFSARNAGCLHEIRHLVRFVPLGRCVFIVDATTDVVYLRGVLDAEWGDLEAESPNRQVVPETFELHRFDAGGDALPRLLRRLCHAS